MISEMFRRPWLVLRLQMLAAVILIVECLFAAGCNSSPPAPPPAPASDSSSASETANPCEIVLSSVLDTLDLEKLGVSTDLEEMAVPRLNQWRETCGRPVKPSAHAAAFWKKMHGFGITAAELAFIEQLQFNIRDGHHLRDCLLARTISSYAVGKADNDVERVANLFNHVIRAIDLVPEHPGGLPLPHYDVYLRGKGTAEDRASIFISLLRQLKIDAVVLSRDNRQPGARSGTEASPSTDASQVPWLVGVLINEDVYLFDAFLGLPLPAPQTKSGERTGSVATLAQATADPAVLKQFDLDADHPYGLTAEDLKKPRVALPGNSSLWSTRMASLQTQLTGANFMIVFESLADSDLGPGHWSRMAEAGQQGRLWTPDALTLWSYHEDQLAGYAALSPEQKKNYAQFNLTWSAPQFPEAVKITNADGSEGMAVRFKAENDQFKGRLDQINGRFQEAVVAFTHVRLWRTLFPAGMQVPLGIQAINARAADDAAFWIGVCLFEQGEHAVAAQTFEKYLKANVDGNWIAAARLQLALSLVAQKKISSAVAALENVPPESPHYWSSRLLIRRWKSAAKN